VSTTNEPIVIVLTCDDRYVRHAAATMVSIVKNSKRYFNFYLLDCGITLENLEKLKQLDLAGNTLQVIKPKLLEVFEKFPLPSHFSPAIFYRVAIPELFPEMNKAIYMDSDIIVTGDIGPLWDKNLEDKLLGVVYSENQFLPSSALEKYKNKIGLKQELRYFYDGMMLMNLDALRKENIFQKVLSYIPSCKHSLICPEQDILNILLDRNKLLELDAGYNFTPFSPLSSNLKSIKPICLHYSIYKPWCYPKYIVNWLPLQLFREMRPYYFYAQQTPWIDVINKDARLYLVAKALWKLTFQPLERFLKRYFRKNK
jgi:lipopolysaccharide biosynthesis glycosyltransferase